MKIKYLILILLVYSTRALAADIKMIAWWDDIAEDIITEFKEKKFNIEMTVYKSNEVALTKLFSGKEKYDVAIISNAILDALIKNNLIKEQFSSSLFSKRKYYHFLDTRGVACVPYMWSATVFAGPTKIDDMESLLAISKKNKNIVGIIDDKFEVWARSILDFNKKCTSDLAFVDLNQCVNKDINTLSSFDKSIFQTSIGDFVKSEDYYVYGWHGELTTVINKYKNNKMKISPGKNRPVIGYDLVCVLSTGAKGKEVEEFVELLTNKRNTQKNVSMSQYFSPYVDDFGSLRGVFKKLQKEVLYKMKTEKPIYLVSPPKAYHDIVNSWWREVRY